MWVNFALGKGSIAGKHLIYPTGKYAASISFKKEGESTVAIVQDESIAPEGAILESGHKAVDLKQRLQWGRAYPMHRHSGAASGSRRTRMWAQAYGSNFSGFASIGPNSPAGSWVIPPMVAYAPAANLARMAKDMR